MSLALLDAVNLPTYRAPRAGDVLAGKYRLRERIGAGGMGAVFLAEHLELARSVAIKVLHPHLAIQEAAARRFRTEAIAASRVQHRGTVEVIELGVAASGTLFIAMELVPGRPLGHILAEEVIPLQRALGILDQILEALDAAHACAIVHADVKSDNFLVQQTAGGDVVTMIDFGLARLDGDHARSSVVVGTPEYIAPELICGDAPTVASDLYGAGVILYELLTDTTPFAGGSVPEILTRQLEAAVVPPSQRRPDRELPRALDELVLRALAKDPHARFASARDFRAALAAVAAELAAAPRRRERAATAGSIPRREPAVPAAPPAGRLFARGSAPGDAGPSDELRRAIAGALVRGDVLEIASGYEELADRRCGLSGPRVRGRHARRHELG